MKVPAGPEEGCSVAPPYIEKFEIFRTIFWVSHAENSEIAGSTGAAGGSGTRLEYAIPACEWGLNNPAYQNGTTRIVCGIFIWDVDAARSSLASGEQELWRPSDAAEAAKSRRYEHFTNCHVKFRKTIASCKLWRERMLDQQL